MKRFILSAVSLISGLSLMATVPTRMVIPDVDGYKTLKGDFHIHTVISDADVWPTNRVQEAYLEGLDFISITDHLDSRIQHKKHKLDSVLTSNRDLSYELAASVSKKYDVLVIHGCEVSRGMPPGHFNMHFVTSATDICTGAEALDNAEETNHFAVVRKALEMSREQGGLNIWNHPHWNRQAPNETKWYPEHTKLFKAGILDGIEIYNGDGGYSPEAHHWANERNMILVSGTDTHTLIDIEYPRLTGGFRPVTLVFASERSLEGIREALVARRSAVFADGRVYGTEATLAPLFDACVELTVVSKKSDKLVLKAVNKSSIPVMVAKPAGKSKTLTYTRNFTLNPFEEIQFTVYQNSGKSKDYELTFDVENWFVDGGVPLRVVLKY